MPLATVLLVRPIKAIGATLLQQRGLCMDSTVTLEWIAFGSQKWNSMLVTVLVKFLS